MRIAFTGKGGSGKTTVASLFARVAADDSMSVLALDADINQHLAAGIGYQGELRSMGTDLDVIKKHIIGSRRDVTVQTMHKTTPPAQGSRLVRLTSDDWFIQQFTALHSGIWLAGAGEIPEGNIGIKCYHGLNGAVELVLAHLIDRQDDIVLVDMTAGADAFSSSLFTKVDALVLVVEPSLKSIAVYSQFVGHARTYEVPLVVIANKVQDAADRDFINQHIPTIAAWIPVSGHVRSVERGRSDMELEPGITSELRKLRASLLDQPIDWTKREQLSHRMYLRAVPDGLIDQTYSLADKAAL